MRKEHPVKTTKLTEGGFKGEEESEHPAFGQVSLHRCTGHTKLYGSALDKHDEFISLTVHRSTQRHGLGQNWYHASIHRLCEIWLSAAQFADMITGMNRGGGVPCTLKYVDGVEQAEIPWDHATESKKVVDKFKEEVAETVESLNAEVEKLRGLLEKKSLTKAEREKAMSAIDTFNHLYRSNAPFMVEQFQEAASKVVTSAKAEVEALAHRVTVEAGVRVLHEANKSEQKRLKTEPPCKMCGGTTWVPAPEEMIENLPTPMLRSCPDCGTSR